MTFYGIRKKYDPKGKERVVAVASWRSSTARPPAGAVEWATGEIWDGDNFITLPGRKLYMAPKGWRRPRGHVTLAELAEAIEEACQKEAT